MQLSEDELKGMFSIEKLFVVELISRMMSASDLLCSIVNHTQMNSVLMEFTVSGFNSAA